MWSILFTHFIGVDDKISSYQIIQLILKQKAGLPVIHYDQKFLAPAYSLMWVY